MTKTPASPEKLGTVERAAALMKAVAEEPGDFTVQQMSQKLKLPASTTHRLLQLLIDQDLVAPAATPHRYTIGMALYRIGALIASRTQISVVAQHYLQAVTDACGETCLLGVYLPQQRKMMFATAVSGNHPLQYRVSLHEPMSVYWGASGQTIMAWLPSADVELIGAEAGASPTLATPPIPPAEMADRLALIRERGYGITRGEKLPDAIGIAAPVFGAGNRIVGDLCVTVPAARFSDGMESALTSVLMEQARELSLALGGTARERT